MIAFGDEDEEVEDEDEEEEDVGMSTTITEFTEGEVGED